MELSVRKERDGTLIVEMSGVDAYLPNLLRQELWKDDTITFAAFDKDHPHIGTPKLIVRGKNPEESLLQAVKRLKNTFKQLEDAFRSSFKAQ